MRWLLQSLKSQHTTKKNTENIKHQQQHPIPIILVIVIVKAKIIMTRIKTVQSKRTKGSSKLAKVSLSSGVCISSSNCNDGSVNSYKLLDENGRRGEVVWYYVAIILPSLENSKMSLNDHKVVRPLNLQHHHLVVKDWRENNHSKMVADESFDGIF